MGRFSFLSEPCCFWQEQVPAPREAPERRLAGREVAARLGHRRRPAAGTRRRARALPAVPGHPPRLVQRRPSWSAPGGIPLRSPCSSGGWGRGGDAEIPSVPIFLKSYFSIKIRLKQKRKKKKEFKQLPNLGRQSQKVFRQEQRGGWGAAGGTRAASACTCAPAGAPTYPTENWSALASEAPAPPSSVLGVAAGGRCGALIPRTGVALPLRAAAGDSAWADSARGAWRGRGRD